MRFRPDLVKQLQPEDFLEEVLADNHRYQPEPTFSRTGVGILCSASVEERAQEEARNTELIRRLEERSKRNSSNETA
jgi:hypothetical protein